MQVLAHGLIRRSFRLALVIVFTSLMLAIGGCNTIAGMGEDVSAAGQTVADWAEPESK